MTFLSSATLLGLLLVALPIGIHLLARRRARRLDFPSLRFLRETPSFRLRPRRISEPLLLALRCAAIILLVLGLARPLLTFHASSRKPIHFILLDASLSMKARGRAEAAKEQARSIINHLTNEERAAIISFSSEPVVLADAVADKSRLLEAVEGYKPVDGAADYNAGFNEVFELLRTEPQGEGEVDIISDFQRAGLEGRREFARKADGLRVLTYMVGSSVERNAFLVDESARRIEHGLELSATEIVSDHEGRSGARRTWTIDAREGVRSGIEWRTEMNGQITGRMKTIEPDDSDADDERFFALQPTREGRALLIENDDDATLYMRAALEAARGAEGKVRLDVRRELPESAAETSSYSLIALTLHSSPREDQLGALNLYARAGGTVWMTLSRDLDTESWNATAGREGVPSRAIARVSGRTLSFGAMDRDAQEFRALDESALATLRAVRINDGFALEPSSLADTLMRWNDGRPAFVSARIGEGKILLLGTSAERASSELGSSAAFPALASSILRSAELMKEPLSETIGEPLRLKVAPDTDVKITDMEGRVVETKVREVISHPLRYFSGAGIYRLDFSGQQKFVAFNSPVEESERALSTEDDLKRFFSVEKSEGARTLNENRLHDEMERQSSTWRYFLVAAFLLMIAELFVAMRKSRWTIE